MDAPPAARCRSEGEVPSIAESRALPTGTAGGPNAWFDAKVTWTGPLTVAGTTIDAPLTVGRITTTITDSRQIQLALKYLF